MIAERWRGAAAGLDDVVCVLAGERMGAGIMVGGPAVRGHEGAAGELPFLGAHEVEHGAEGIADLTRTLGADAVRRSTGSLSRLAGGDPDHIDAPLVFAAARDGDPVAIEIIDRVLARAGRSIVPLAQVLNPEVVVIGGGVAAAGDTLVEPLRRQLAERAWLPPASRPQRSPNVASSSGPSDTRSTTSSRAYSKSSKTPPNARRTLPPRDLSAWSEVVRPASQSLRARVPLPRRGQSLTRPATAMACPM